MAKAKESPARCARGTGIGLASPLSLSTRGRPATAARSVRSPAVNSAAVASVVSICLAALGASPGTTTPTPPLASSASTSTSTTPGGKMPISGPGPLALLGRTVEQDQGAWQVEYRFRNEGEGGVVLTSGEIAARVDGWVSNSRIASHALPRRSSIVLAKGSGPSPGAGGLSGSSSGAGLLAAEGTIIDAPEEARRCKERLVVSLRPDDLAGCASCPSHGGTAATASGSGSGSGSTASPGESVVSVAPGGTLRVRLRLEHQHVVHGDYDPLLGERTVELTLGPAALSDVIPLDREQRRAQPKVGAIEIPEDRRDTERFYSAPYSLHLAAHIPGQQYCRLPERPVRYDTKMRLRFWYLVAAGTDGDCRLRFSQVRETPVACPPLSKGNFEQYLKAVGRWTKVERIIRTEPEATHVVLDFGIVTDSYVGEMWIDDISLEPLEVSQAGP